MKGVLLALLRAAFPLLLLLLYVAVFLFILFCVYYTLRKLAGSC